MFWDRGCRRVTETAESKTMVRWNHRPQMLFWETILASTKLLRSWLCPQAGGRKEHGIQKWPPIRASGPGLRDWFMGGNTTKPSQLELCPELSQESLGQMPSFPCFKLQRGWSREWPSLPQSVGSLPENEANSTENWGMCLSTWIQLYLKPALEHFSVIEQNHIQLPVLDSVWPKTMTVSYHST